MSANTTLRERRNWHIHLLYIRHDFKDCLKLIEQQLQECSGMCEYAVYTKALIRRQQGQVADYHILSLMVIIYYR
eukprot:SAG31_NODE_5941_length_2247_cov_1.585661_1_plen_75_part_00